MDTHVLAPDIPSHPDVDFTPGRLVGLPTPIHLLEPFSQEGLEIILGLLPAGGIPNNETYWWVRHPGQILQDIRAIANWELAKILVHRGTLIIIERIRHRTGPVFDLTILADDGYPDHSPAIFLHDVTSDDLHTIDCSNRSQPPKIPECRSLAMQRIEDLQNSTTTPNPREEQQHDNTCRSQPPQTEVGKTETPGSEQDRPDPDEGSG